MWRIIHKHILSTVHTKAFQGEDAFTLLLDYNENGILSENGSFIVSSKTNKEELNKKDIFLSKIMKSGKQLDKFWSNDANVQARNDNFEQPMGPEWHLG